MLGKVSIEEGSMKEEDMVKSHKASRQEKTSECLSNLVMIDYRPNAH